MAEGGLFSKLGKAIAFDFDQVIASVIETTGDVSSSIHAGLPIDLALNR